MTIPLDTTALTTLSLTFAAHLSSVPPLTLLVSVLAVTTGLLLLAYTTLYILAPVPRPPYPEETRYRTIGPDGTVTEPLPLPVPAWLSPDQKAQEEDRDGDGDGQDDGEVFMSVVVPAYNEEERLPGMLVEAVKYLESQYGSGEGGALSSVTNANTNTTESESDAKPRRRKHDDPTTSASTRDRGYEILIVSDGSTDNTTTTALRFARSARLAPGTIRVISLTANKGKGGAVTHGMRHVRGRYVVFADADGASEFGDLGRLVEACRGVEDGRGRGVAVGSRAHLVGSEAVVKRSKLRNFLMHSFHLILRLLTPPATATIKDTQCGFKLFSRPALPDIVPYMHCQGWIFDVEMLMLAEFAHIRVAEVPVGWHEVKGSKLNILWDSLGMAYGLALLRAAWSCGVYRRAA